MTYGTLRSSEFRCFLPLGFFTCIVLSMLFPGFADGQSVLTKIGYADLQAEFMGAEPDGSNATVALVEAVQGAVMGDPTSGSYLPSLAGASLSGKTINDISMSRVGTSTHSTNSAVRLFGTVSSSPGVDNVDVYEAGDWLNNVLGVSPTSLPATTAPNVSSHSYVVTAQVDDPSTPLVDETFGPDQAKIYLKHLDYHIQTNNTTAVVGGGNSIPLLLVPAYNAISVGLSTSNPTSATTSFYGTGRTKVDIVAPETTTSKATPRVASVAAVLYDGAVDIAGTNASQNQTIKATLLAGATIDDVFAADWDRTTTRPLDDQYGAGQVNVYQSYKIQQGGETEGTVASGGPAVGDYGWDYKDLADGSGDRFYQFEILDGELLNNELKIALAWDLKVDFADLALSSYEPAPNLTNFDLSLFDSTNTLIDASLSTVDNVEHIRINDLAAGTYSLRVSGDANDSYGLAWRFTFDPVTVPEPGTGLLGLFLSTMVLARRRSR